MQNKESIQATLAAPQYFSTDSAKLQSNAWKAIQEANTPILSDDDTLSTVSLHQMTGGMTNICFKLRTKNGVYFVRLPGKGSSDHLSRWDEAFNLKVAESLGLNVQMYYFNSETGMYVSEFLENTTPLATNNLSRRQTLNDVAKILKKLHQSPTPFNNDIPIFDRLHDLIRKIEAPKRHAFMYDANELKLRLNILERICKKDVSELVPCHNDTTPLNFLYHRKAESKKILKLLDWEYSGNNKALFDLANFAVTAKLTKPAEQTLLQSYFGTTPTKQLWHVFDAYKQATRLWYYLWAELQLANKSNVIPKDQLIDVAQKNYNAVMTQEVHLPKHRTRPLRY